MKLTIKKKLTKESADKIINSRKLITSTGKFIVKVKNAAFTKERKLIVNVNACTQMQLDVYNNTVNDDLQYEVNRCQLSFSGKMNFIPEPGEYVEVVIDVISTYGGKNKDFRIVELNKLTINNPTTIKELLSGTTPVNMLAADVAENMGIDSDMPL